MAGPAQVPAHALDRDNRPCRPRKLRAGPRRRRIGPL